MFQSVTKTEAMSMSMSIPILYYHFIITMEYHLTVNKEKNNNTCFKTVSENIVNILMLINNY